MDARVLKYDSVGEGEPLVLVPGGLTGWVSWAPHQELLSAHHRVVRVQPIHNELGSAGMRGDPDYSAEIERESLLLTLDSLEIGDAHFAGWSRGGGMLIDFCLAHPDRVRDLALIEPAVSWILELTDEAEVLAHRASNDFLAGLEATEVSEDDLARVLVLAGLLDESVDARLHPMWDRWVTHRATLSWPYDESGRMPKSAEDLQAIDIPVLLVKGTRSDQLDRRTVDVLAEHLPNARVVELEGSHASHIENLELFVSELEKHLHSDR